MVSRIVGVALEQDEIRRKFEHSIGSPLDILNKRRPGRKQHGLLL